MQEISLNILDIAQNSVTAHATSIEITVDEQPEKDYLKITVKDNGCGMTEQQLAVVTDPFYTKRKTRKVGLGVPLFKMAAELTGGCFSIESTLNVGTTVCAKFILSNIDTMPLGDINSTIITLIQCNPDLQFIYKCVFCDREFTLNTLEIKELLGGVPITSYEVMSFIKDYLYENEQEIKVSPERKD
jgi:anti-sigma regulatory factor (Ser/Thr protein kinase)